MGSVDFVLVFLTILVFGVGAGVFFWIRRMGQVEVSDTIVFNEDRDSCAGKVIGRLQSYRAGKNGRLHITYVPIDCEDKTPVEVIKESNKVVMQPKKTLSSSVSVIRILPDDALAYFSTVMKTIEQGNAEIAVIEAQKEGLNRKDMHLMEIGEGELSGADLGAIKSVKDEFLKAGLKDHDKGRPPYNRPDLN